MVFVYTGIIAGIIATIGMDMSNLIFTRLGLIDNVQFKMIGRYAHGFFRGKLYYKQATMMEETRHDLLIGILAHYIAGIIFGLVFVFLFSLMPVGTNVLMLSIAFGIATLLVPWCIFIPAIGFGFFCSKIPSPVRSRVMRTTAINHFDFGIGLYLGVVLSRFLFGLS